MKFADKDKFSSYLKKWQTLLCIINASLENVEEKQTSSRSLELWLSDLRDVAYDAEDIIDELTTEARRRQITEDPDAASPSCKVGIILIIQAIDSDSGESYAANAFAIWIWRREKSTVAELLDYQLFVALPRTWK
ncbi:putative disease resistance RPP13-like protein 1 isoform X1 [Gossypium raimondii]|uniref:putative disease resistance RPP13-like protein 1 isoform X1 n=1 Tax=Gossypium raimondii TaxID=29730 RepID=UPI00063AAF3C|nr:putative disease resistance RPP13-like protein 1 isoform X1 [Gossypium raimondii]